MKSLFSQSDAERRAGIAATNLFFSVVLGANLGSINSLELYDYVLLLMLLSGSVMALFTIAVSKRRRVVWSLAAIYGLVLGGMVLFPELRPDRMEEEILRIIATLGFWLLLLLMMRLSPTIEDAEPARKPVIDDEDEVAELLSGEQRV